MTEQEKNDNEENWVLQDHGIGHTKPGDLTGRETMHDELSKADEQWVMEGSPYNTGNSKLISGNHQDGPSDLYPFRNLDPFAKKE
jgi:hypothetical protein